MFKYRWPKKIISDQGFEVKYGYRNFIIYKEYKKSMYVDTEHVKGYINLLIYKNSIKEWKPPFDIEPISDLRKNEILENIKAALEFRKMKFEVY